MHQPAYLWLATCLPLVGWESRNGKKVDTIVMGYLGTTIRIPSFIPSQPKALNPIRVVSIFFSIIPI